MSGLRVPAAALLRAVERNAIAFPMLPHQRETTTALAFAWLLSEGDVWALNAIKRLTSPSPRQIDTLNAICAKVERGRK